jgi:uncharacterized protein (DUF3820 family)
MRKQPVKGGRITFGKFKSQPYRDIPQYYLEWLLKQDWLKPIDRKRSLAALKEFLPIAVDKMRKISVENKWRFCKDREQFVEWIKNL